MKELLSLIRQYFSLVSAPRSANSRESAGTHRGKWAVKASAPEEKHNVLPEWRFRVGNQFGNEVLLGNEEGSRPTRPRKGRRRRRQPNEGRSPASGIAGLGLSVLAIALIVALASGCGQSQFLPYGTGRTKPAPSPSEGGTEKPPRDDTNKPSGGETDEPAGDETDEPAGSETDTPTGDEADGPSDDDDEVGSEGDFGTPCQGFAQAVASVDYGANAGFGQSSFPSVVLGPPRGGGAMMGGMHVLSLGTDGEIVLDLGTCHAVDGDGADFIVFENSFLIGGNPANPFAEPGIVGASLNGTGFVDFPCDPDAYPYTGCAGWHPVLSNPQNGIDPFDPDEAGGEAYDLQEIGAERARYIRIRDAGNGGGGGAAGFDLDAIAVINGRTP